MPDEIKVRVGAAAPHPTQGVSNAQRLLGEGDTGPDVKALQEQLKQAGFDCGKADGIFGSKTTKALKAFQQSKGIHPVDGLLGANTRKSLDAASPQTNDQKSVSKDAVSQVNKRGNGAEIMNYPTQKSRLDQQKEAGQAFLNQLAKNAQVAAVAFNPIFAPVALSISMQAQARIFDRYENETPQKPLEQIQAEEEAKAQQAILALPGVYAQAGMKGLQAIGDAANAFAASVAWCGTAVGNQIASAYDAAVDFGEQAVATAQEVGTGIVQEAKREVKAGWHWATTPIRLLGEGLSWLGSAFKGVG